MANDYPNREQLLASLLPPWPDDLLADIRAQIAASGRKVVVLDDDPTGTQTVHDVPVLTTWSVDILAAELSNDLPAFYILTNSRSVPQAAAETLNQQIGSALRQASARSQRPFVVVSRSDSTLRGHFPAEVTALADGLQQTFDAWLLIPFFLEGGRYTIDDVHYVAEGEQFVPAGETEFARDHSFGFRASNLRAWVAEKTGGRIPAAEVDSISLQEIRGGGPQQVAKHLEGLSQGRICVVNTASLRDLQVVTLALLQAEAVGKRFLYRTAASFVPVRAGIVPRPLLTAHDLHLPQTGGGLIVVGSYVPKTTTQVNALLEQGPILRVEVDVHSLLDDQGQAGEIARVVEAVDQALQAGQDVVVYTSRRLMTGTDSTHSLSIGQRVSQSLVKIVQTLSVRPRYLLAKGGITSSDLATHGLGVARALVQGQILPGVPVWQTGAESHFPGLTYIVFPGNVGGPQALVDVVARLKRY